MTLMQAARTKHDLIDEIANDHSWFEDIIRRVPRDRIDEPALPGGWSVKDALGHIAWGHRQGAEAARTRALVGSDLWRLSQDERNAIVRRETRSKTIDQVVDEFGESVIALRAAIEQLSEDELNDPARMAGLAQAIPGWRPWRVLYDPGHYREHGRTIEEWLVRSSGR